MNKVTMPQVAQSVEEEVMLAYADAHGNRPFEETMNIRNLNFKASAPVTRNEAVRIMSKAVSRGYNEFTADKLKLLPKDSMVTIARESSPCVYVTPPIEERIDKMKADEWGTNDGVTRIWYD